MKKVCVNEDACIGCGACVSIAEEYFKFNEEGFSTAVKDVVADGDLDIVEEAASCCPVDAIEIEDVESTEDLAA